MWGCNGEVVLLLNLYLLSRYSGFLKPVKQHARKQINWQTSSWQGDCHEGCCYIMWERRTKRKTQGTHSSTSVLSEDCGQFQEPLWNGHTETGFTGLWVSSSGHLTNQPAGTELAKCAGKLGYERRKKININYELCSNISSPPSWCILSCFCLFVFLFNCEQSPSLRISDWI